jgi:hypothetical protein
LRVEVKYGIDDWENETGSLPGKAFMKKIIALLAVAAFGLALTANAQVFGVAFGRPGISVAVGAPAYYGPGVAYPAAPVYSAPVAPYPYSYPYYSSPYYDYPYGYWPSVGIGIAPYWGWGGWGGGWRGGYGYRGGFGGFRGGFHGGGGHGGGHR